MNKTPNVTGEPGGLDELDLRLLSALQNNARSTFADLGEAVGLKASAVHDRVKRLESRGYVRGYAAQLDGKLLGLELVAFVGCYTAPDCSYDALLSRLKSVPGMARTKTTIVLSTPFERNGISVS